MYSGYLDVDYGAKHLFFYFFESRNQPDIDPVLMCIHGPPKLGSNGTEWNPYSWNNKANLFFLDQPYVVGVGFSYADYGETVSTTEEAAKNVQAFVTIFFETFSKFKGREFHMSGESYGGRYLPVFASEIIDQNKRATAGGFAPINLKSVLIGNGMTDFKSMSEAYYEIQCKNLSVVPFQDINRNPYDMTKPCTSEELSTSLCYPLTKHINSFLDLPETRKALGVHPSIGNYTGCSRDVGVRFSQTLDHFHSNQYYVAGLLERGIKVLIYVGTYDYICNWVGNQKWTRSLDWTGSIAYAAAEDREWTVESKVAGIARSAHGLTFATINAAGHMVPYDKPKEALVMLNRWLNGEEL
ncbi:hypothetical protein FRC07_005743 [Ceratobasidium sp. 392]|nr:hypothetical protein FRC07_005743 [Ceratobasidium sp. 392]